MPWLLSFCFLLSGLCSLVYEVVWVREFTLITGNTVYSVSTVVAAFMTGLAGGAYLSGRLVERGRNPLRIYGLCEVAIGAYVLLVPWLVEWSIPLFASLYTQATSAWMGAVRSAISFLILAVPTTLMGATLPAISRHFAAMRPARASLEMGRLYAINTVGGALGCLASGFVLLPLAGINVTTWVACGLSMTAGAVALVAAARQTIPPANPVMEARPQPAPALVLLSALFLSGVTSMLYEIAWTRAFGLALGPTTYTFSLILTVFLIGLAAGSWMGTRFPRALCAPQWLGAVQVLIAAALVAIVVWCGRLPLIAGEVVRVYASQYWKLQLVYLGLVSALLLAPVVLLGTVFPAVIRLLITRAPGSGAELGRAYAVSTAGCIAGSLLAGFALLPALGVERTILAGAGLNCAVAAVFWLSAQPRPRRFLVPAAVALALAVALLPRQWDMELWTSGAYKYAANSADLDSAMRQNRLVFLREGLNSVVSVRRLGNNLSLSIDGKVDASDAGGDLATEKLLAHVPLLWADHARSLCVIGLASGITAGAALTYPIDRLDIVERSAEVVEASAWFRGVNNEVLHDPRTRLFINDGRSHLLLSQDTYDVIISEPSNPWMAGVNSLFTREFFEIAKRRLNANGILAQWFHTYNMSADDLRSLIRTFQEVFPGATLWAFNEQDLLLLSRLGTEAPSWPARAAARSDLNQIGVRDLYGLLSLYLSSGDDLRRFAGDAPVNTDDSARLEFSAPTHMYEQTNARNYGELAQFPRRMAPPAAVAEALERATAQEMIHKAAMYEAAESLRDAFREYSRAVERDPEARPALDGLRRCAQSDEDQRRVSGLLETLSHQPGRDGAARLVLASLKSGDGDFQGCLDLVTPLASRPQWRQLALDQLAECQEQSGDLAAAARTSRELLQNDPANLRARNVLAVAFAEAGHRAEAQALFEDTIRLHPQDAITYFNYGVFCVKAERYQQAMQQFRKAIDLDASNLEAYQALADLYRKLGRGSEAIEFIRAILARDPQNPAARRTLAELVPNDPLLGR